MLSMTEKKISIIAYLKNGHSLHCNSCFWKAHGKTSTFTKFKLEYHVMKSPVPKPAECEDAATNFRIEASPEDYV